jgi:hypothetical protein
MTYVSIDRKTTLHYQFIDKFCLTEHQQNQIQALLQICFGTPTFLVTRTYYKQILSRRLLAWQSDDSVGHMGVEHRGISVAKIPLKIFGVIDLCIAPRYPFSRDCISICSNGQRCLENSTELRLLSSLQKTPVCMSVMGIIDR